MDDTQLLRHARHIQLPDLDYTGVEKILAARIIIVGMGGLGSPAALYLAASGVGHLTLIDDDTVELSNIQRQIIHSTNRIGWSKVASAQCALNDLNPDVVVDARPARVNEALLNALLPDADVVLDCSDNFATRHLINRLCQQHQKPLVSGAAIRFDGQISVYDARNPDSPCYACLFPPTATFDDEPCIDLGVFSPLVGIIGAMQAAEALKLLTSVSEPLTGRLLTLDARTMTWHSTQVNRNTSCMVCGN